MIDQALLTWLLENSDLTELPKDYFKSMEGLIKEGDPGIINHQVLCKLIRLADDELALVALKNHLAGNAVPYFIESPVRSRLMEECLVNNMTSSAKYIAQHGEPGFIRNEDEIWPEGSRPPLIYAGLALHGVSQIWGFPILGAAMPKGLVMTDAFVSRVVFLAQSLQSRLTDAMNDRGMPYTYVEYHCDVPHGHPWPMACFWIEVSGLDEHDESALMFAAKNILTAAFGEPEFTCQLPKFVGEDGMAITVDKEASKLHRMKNGSGSLHKFAKKSVPEKIVKGWQRA